MENLCILAAKTTCKDRWRQVLNEADRLRDRHKYLCTMQKGIFSAQMDEMKGEQVILVVPKPYITAYPKNRQERIWTIGKFVHYVRDGAYMITDIHSRYPESRNIDPLSHSRQNRKSISENVVYEQP